MKRLVLAVSFFILTLVTVKAEPTGFVSIAPEPRSHAWWLRAEFTRLNDRCVEFRSAEYVLYDARRPSFAKACFRPVLRLTWS